MGLDEHASVLIGLDGCPGVLQGSEGVAARSPQFTFWNAVAHIFEKGMDTAGKGLVEVGDAAVGDLRRRGAFGGGSGPVCDLFDAVFDAEGAAGPADFDAPPAAVSEGGVAALAEQIAGGAAGKLQWMR